jgi:ATP-dependent Lon protease
MDDTTNDPDIGEEIFNLLDNDKAESKPLETLPKELYIIPILRRPFFPGMAAPLSFEESSPFYALIKKALAQEHKCVALVLTKKEEVDPARVSYKDLYKVGVLARILRVVPVEKEKGIQVIFNMEQRVELTKSLSDPEHLFAKVICHPDINEQSDTIKAYSISIISTIKELLKLNPLFKEELQIFIGHSDFTAPGKLADFATALTTATREEMQEILESFDIPIRIERALALLKKELDLSKLQQNINKKIETTITKGQRDFFLKEQLKTIKRELGIEKDDKSVDRDKFESRLKDRSPPAEVQQVIDEEIEKLATLEPQSAEYGVSRGYLDWLTIIPWGKSSKERHNLKEAKKILEEDHFGLKDIKERILEFISVGKLAGGVKGSIICLIGPPGVGKTSVGKSIARALNREFYRFSVGGMRDEAEIKGHRRTYIGAMPGKLIQALKFCQTMNPVIMLDEVDKIGTSYHGDPASALLEVLDPEQNKDFLDHYLDVRVDLSDVLFILTANVLDTIPEPLIDRMEILRLSGYIMEEKIAIAEKYLIPKNRKQMGIKSNILTFTKTGLKQLINGYARESGVRNLENLIKKIMRKVAFELVVGQEKKKSGKSTFNITPQTLEHYVGKPEFTSERFYEKNPVGVATGLAWTALGGAVLYIEVIKIPSEKTEMKLTGQAGSVMKESSEIAWSFLHSAIHKYAPGFTFFEKTQVHMHIPEGATPKDGPSAGITMVTALLSLLTASPIKEDLGMSGEITLTGRVLPVGGLKEKVVAARRAGLKTLIFPKENQRDIALLPEHITKGIEIHFVEDYDQVLPIAFGENLSPLGEL